MDRLRRAARLVAQGLAAGVAAAVLSGCSATCEEEARSDYYEMTRGTGQYDPGAGDEYAYAVCN